MLDMNGVVYLIGAGPGDPGLLTLRGAELLGRCDVVLYDGLSNVELLAHAPRAQHISVGKHGQTRIWRQDEIIAEMLKHARAGKTVARLKGGDPAVFARTAEEVDALKSADISFEIVPGITAALAAGSYAGIPITHRGLASAVALVTGHEEPGKSESALDWDALAKFPGTLVIYMGVTTASTWSQALLDSGKPPGTPVAIIRRCSLPDQQSIHCRLDEVTDRLTPANKFRPPAIVIIGAVTELAATMDWVQKRPLFGQTVLVTRPQDQAEALARPLRDLGARVLLQPAICIRPVDDSQDLDRIIESIGDYDFLVFCSHNGVNHFMKELVANTHLDLRDIRAKIACVGSRTAQTLSTNYHLRPEFVPDDFRAEALAGMLADHVGGKRVLIVRASRGKDNLADSLSDLGAKVTQVVAYSHTDLTEADPAIKHSVEAGEVDWITVTSCATADSLHQMLAGSLADAKLASLSPVTSERLRELGYEVAAEADPYTIRSLVENIVAQQSQP
ncbi:MAG: uroporphyrinogen-III C-methyltransferase [Rubripirellula sp.]